MKFRVFSLFATLSWLTGCGEGSPVQPEPEPECHAFSVDLAPRDTAVSLGSTLTLVPAVLQNCPVELDWEYDSALLSLQNGVFTPRAAGRTRLYVRASGTIDSTQLSIVPAGTLAVSGSTWHGEIMGGLYVMNTDLSGRRELTAALPEYVLNATPAWHPDGNLLVFSNGGDFSDAPRHLYLSDLDGRVRRLLPGSTMSAELSPRFSRDGQWIYFSGTENFAIAIYRVRPDGTGLERLTTLDYEDKAHPDPSPDGTRLLFSAATAGTTMKIQMLDLRTGVVAPMGMEGVGAAWSPSGDQIAYEAFGKLHVMNADGTGSRRLTLNETYYDMNLDWSADGRWIAAAQPLGFLEFIEVATGKIVPLPYGVRYLHPAWKR